MRLSAGVIFACVTLFFASQAHAASLYLDPSIAEVNKGDTVSLALRLDTTAGECINSLDVVLDVDPGLQVADVSTGNSIFSLWVQPPTFDNDAHTISLAGGIPNGYCGRVEGDPELTNTIAEIILRIPSFSIGEQGTNAERYIRFTDTANAYLNDGRGTAIKLATSDAKIVVGTGFSTGENDKWRERVAADTEAPKQFSIILTKDDTTFHGKYYISFNTTDKQTGIDHYEVLEEPINQFDLFRWGAATTPWKEISSPYELEDQSLNSIIRVKALDKAGNEYVATLVPDASMRGLNSDTAIIYALLLFCILVLGAVIWILIVHVRRRHIHDVQHQEREQKSPPDDDLPKKSLDE